MDSTRPVVRYPGDDTTEGYGAPMDAAALIDYLRDELRRSGHPAISEVTDLDSPGVAVRCDDGAKLFTKVAWAGRPGQQPTQPQWPSREDLAKGGRR